MTSFLEKQELEICSLLSFRGKVMQDEIPAIMQKLKGYADLMGAKPKGGPVSVTFGTEQTDSGLLMDTEIMMPVDRQMSSNDEIKWKERLFLTNALCLKYSGSPALFQNACMEMNTYIAEKKLQPITAGYTVTRSADQLTGNVEMDVYVGLNPNIL